MHFLFVSGARTRIKAKTNPGAPRLRCSMQFLLLVRALSWVRACEAVTVPKEPCKETPEEFAGRLRDIYRYINQHYDVSGACKSSPKRVQMVGQDK